MSDIDKKVEVYAELAKIDPFEFWDTDMIDKEFTPELKRLKKRHWLFIVYPESAPEDWKEKMKLTGVQFAISPLHDKDRLVDGDLKKPHWHMIVIFDGPTTFMTAASYRGITNGPYPKVCENLRGSFEYFTHKNDPDKYQYSESDIELYNGFEIDLSAKDVLKIKKELSELILKQNITEYMEFNMYVQYYLEADYFDVASNNTYYFNSLISSFRHNPEKIKARYRAIKAEISNLEDTNEEMNMEDLENDSRS